MAELAKRFPGSTSEARIIAGVLLSSNPSFTIDVSDMSHLTLQIALTWAAASSLTLTPEGSVNVGNSYGRIATLSPASGAVTIALGTWALAVAASKEFCLDFPAGRYDKMRFTLGHVGATTDLVSAWIVGSK